MVMLRRLVIATVACGVTCEEVDYVRYPGFAGAPGVPGYHDNTTVNGVEDAAGIAACNVRCDAGPVCSCTSFQPTSSNCPKMASCPASAERQATRGALSATAYASSEDSSLKLSAISSPVSGSLSKPDWKLTVDDTASGKRQEVDGFGASWTDATVAVFDELSSSQQTQLMEELFGASGIGIGFMRHTIGQSDLTPNWIGRWSYDENSDQPDPTVSHFNLTDPGRKMTEWLKRMFQIKPDVMLLGSPWSPPDWMKSGNRIQAQYEDAWVKYFVKYLQAFKDLGVNVDAMTIQNEPLHSSDAAWTSYIGQTQAATLTNKLTPAISAAGLDTKIWAYDHNTDKASYPAYVLANSPQVDTVAWHCYGGGWQPMTDFHNAHPGVKQYMTECWTHLNSGEKFFDLPGFLTGPLQNYASGALAWTLGGSTKYDVSYPGGCGPCSGIIQVDRNAKTYEKTHDYYTLGQFSKFVQKGAVFLSGSGSYTYRDGSGVQANSFVNPNGDRVVVLLNQLQNDAHLQIDFKSGDAWNGVVPKRSVTTWVIKGQGPPAPPSPPAPPGPSECGKYCSSTGCGWTAQYSCPWEPAGTKGHAGDDGSTGYKCCCAKRTEKSQPCGGGSSPTPPPPPTPSPPPSECSNYCSSTGCGWTSKYSCPWAPSGTRGHAGDDGSTGYKCCCAMRTKESQPCGGSVSLLV